MEFADIWNWCVSVYYEITLHVFNISISASFFALAVIIFRSIFKKTPKWLVVALWALVAIRLICPFSIESAMSLVPSAETIPLEQMLDNGAQATDTILFDIVKNPNYTEFAGDGAQAALTGFDTLAVVFGVYVWFFGVFAMLLYALISYIKLRRTVRTAIPSEGNVWLCDNVKSPFILGVFRPRIYLPSDMDENTAELVLKHEKAHLKRRDHLWKPFGFVLLSLHWFNPVLWLSYILLCRDIELACDEKVIKDMEVAGKKAYSEALLSCSVSHKMIAACPVAFGEVGVKKRIKSVLNYKKPAFWLIVIALVVSVVIALCFMTDPENEVNGGAVTYNGVDMIDERYFNMDEIISSAAVYTVYDGNSTTDYYFEAPKDYYFCSVIIYNFLYDLPVSTIVDGEVNPMHEPQVNGVIKMSLDNWDVNVIFHDDFQKMYMVKVKADGTSVRSKDYAVLEVEQARAFFTEKPYTDDFRIWEYNPASSALGKGQITFWLDSKYKINGEIRGNGKIEKLTNEGTGADGFSWSPEIVDNPGDYNFEIPVIRDGEERVFTLGMELSGKRGVASYYIIRQGNMRIKSNNESHEYEMTPIYSTDSVEWMYNPRTSDHFTCVLPSGYKIKSVEAASGTTGFYESMFSNMEATVRWTPDKISEDAVLVINAEKDGTSVKFILYIEFLEYFPSGERMSYTISPVNCLMHDEVSGSGIVYLEEKPGTTDDGVIWSYNPSAGATWWYQTKYILPEGYEIKSAEATSGEATIEDLYYDNPDNLKCVCWTPGENKKETELVITALKEGKEVSFKVNIIPVLGNFDSFKITPVNCKMTEETTATFLIEEK